MTGTLIDPDPQATDAAPKFKHRAMWASGDYPRAVASDLTPRVEPGPARSIRC